MDRSTLVYTYIGPMALKSSILMTWAAWLRNASICCPNRQLLITWAAWPIGVPNPSLRASEVKKWICPTSAMRGWLGAKRYRKNIPFGAASKSSQRPPWAQGRRRRPSPAPGGPKAPPGPKGPEGALRCVKAGPSPPQGDPSLGSQGSHPWGPPQFARNNRNCAA